MPQPGFVPESHPACGTTSQRSAADHAEPARRARSGPRSRPPAARSLSHPPYPGPSPHRLCSRERKSRPSVIAAARSQSSIRTFTAAGIGIIRMRPPLPARSGITHPLALLQLVDSQRDHFPAAQPAGDQQCEDGATMLALARCRRRRLQ